MGVLFLFYFVLYCQHMNVEDLIKKRTDAENRFNDLQNQKSEIDIEMTRLQGEYRTYNSLIEEAESTANSRDPATVIDVEESLKQESGDEEDGSK